MKKLSCITIYEITTTIHQFISSQSMCVCARASVFGHVGLPPSLFIGPFSASLLSEVRQEQDASVINTNVVCFYPAAEHTQEDHP